MKKLFLLSLWLMPIAVIPPACSQDKTHHHDGEKKISTWTCPMHPQVHKDGPGDCPICGMKLVPVYEEEAPTGHKEGDPSGVMISSERQQLIGVKTEAVEKKPIVKEIRTTGRVAFDPELAVAIQEYKEVVQNIPSLKKAAENRLKLLGLSQEEIRSLHKQRQSNLYLPHADEPVWVYATLYESEMELVQPGLSALITTPSGEERTFNGIVRAIDPVVDAMTRSVRARIHVPEAGGLLKPDAYVNVAIQVDLGEVVSVAKSAIVATGTRRLVYVVHDGRHFEPREISTKQEAGDRVVVSDGLKEGEVVVTSATFMVDSEAQLKAAIGGGHQH